MSSEPLRILVTGGTFDKAYLELEGRLHFRQTHVPEMLRLGRSLLSVAVEPLMLIDSLEMTDADPDGCVQPDARGRRAHDDMIQAGRV